MIIDDLENEIEQLSIEKVNFLENDHLRSIIHNSFHDKSNEGDMSGVSNDVSFIRMQNEMNDTEKVGRVRNGSRST